ncbi:hypothetical protein HYT02_02095 [Candidatus Gottesmanbacteria bacterium]|nr:hypothetical protein [Candidatus Gottesmanbacteria bacterium]
MENKPRSPVVPEIVNGKQITFKKQQFSTEEGQITVFSQTEFDPSQIHVVGSTGIVVGHGKTSQ